MKRVLALFLLLPALALSQKFQKSELPYTSSSGKVYHVGDTIVIGSPADFSNQFSYYFMGNKLTSTVSAVTTHKVGEEVKTYDKRYRGEIIKQFRIYPDGDTYVVTNKTFNYLINIEKGLETGEILTPKLMELIDNKPTVFSDSIAYLAYLKRKENINTENVKEFLFLFDRNKYNSVREDEFAFHNQMKGTQSFLNETIKDIDTSKTYFIRFDNEIGNFDFDLLSFPLLWNGNGTQILNNTWSSFVPEDINKSGIKLTDLRIYFSNYEDFKHLPLPTEKAQHLINHRKSSSGNVNRKVYMGIQFEIKKLVGNEDLEQGLKFKGDNYLICEIKRIDFFEDALFLYNYLNTVEK